MRRLGTFLLCVWLAMLPACSLLTPQQRSQLTSQVMAEYEAGHITAAQRDAYIEALESDQPFDWEGLGLFGINIVAALVGAPLVVRRMRGPPTQKVGLPADLVKEASK